MQELLTAALGQKAGESAEAGEESEASKSSEQALTRAAGGAVAGSAYINQLTL